MTKNLIPFENKVERGQKDKHHRLKFTCVSLPEDR